MRKILYIFASIVLLISLVACTKGFSSNQEIIDFINNENITIDVIVKENESLVESITMEFDDKKSSFRSNDIYEIYVKTGNKLEIYSNQNDVWLKAEESSKAPDIDSFYKNMKIDMFDEESKNILKMKETSLQDFKFLDFADGDYTVTSIIIDGTNSKEVVLKLAMQIGSRTWTFDLVFKNVGKTSISVPTI